MSRNFIRLRRATQASRFDALLRPHLRLLYRVAYRYTGSREDAEDLVQELLTKLYPRTAELEQIHDLRPWLLRSLYNLFIDQVRKAQRTLPTTSEDADATANAASADADDAGRMELGDALQAAIARLSPEHRAVVMLHLVEGYALSELAQLLDVRIGTLKSRLHRAKRQLRTALRSMEPDSSHKRVGTHELQPTPQRTGS
ncbi:MAG: RNA polymerase sigma factor [Pseudomonadota bacterium]